MKRLFILGNGFDIDHGIECQYRDFGKYLEENHWRFYANIMNAFNQDNHLWMWFEAMLPECAINIEESGLSMGHEMVSDLDYDPCDDMGIGFWLKDQYEFIKELPEVLRDWVKHIDIDKPAKYDFKEEDQFFTFNYTDTLEMMYGMENVIHIHGDVGRNDFLIMGHGNKRDLDWSKEKIIQSQNECIGYAESTYKAVHKYLESTYKDTDQIIADHKDWFDALNGIDEVFIIGQSIGKVDLPYFKKIHECLGDNVQWFLCYYDGCNEIEEIEKVKALLDIGISNLKEVNQNTLYMDEKK